jgi:hypothetical protein
MPERFGIGTNHASHWLLTLRYYLEDAMVILISFSFTGFAISFPFFASRLLGQAGYD